MTDYEEKKWLGDTTKNFKDYSQVITCLALNKAIYEENIESIIKCLNGGSITGHGINQISIAEGCEQRYAVAYKPASKEIYVVFKGDDRYKSISADLNTFGASEDFEGRFHDGYYDTAKLIPLAPFFDLLNSNLVNSLVFTGHSLGGAVASIVAIRMLMDIRLPDDRRNSIYCVTFGSPQVCDQQGSMYVTDSYDQQFHSYINQNDAVPHVLSLLGNIRKTISGLSTPNKVSKEEEMLMVCIQEWFSAIITGNVARKNRFQPMAWLFKENEKHEESNVARLGAKVVMNINSLLHTLGNVLPMFVPFGRHYRSSAELDNSNDPKSMHYLIKVVSKEELKTCLCALPKKYKSSMLFGCEEHFMDSYIREIYQEVIQKYLNDQISRLNPPVQLSTKFENEILSLFRTPPKSKWTHFDIKNSSQENQWSIVRCVFDSQEELTLTLSGLSACLITDIKIENTKYMHNPVQAQDTGFESQRVFVFFLPIHDYGIKNDYPIIINGHFGAENLTGLFEPSLFANSPALKGRRCQIANLPIDKLYLLAFTYSLFTKEREKTNKNVNKLNRNLSGFADDVRRTKVLELLLDTEGKLQIQINSIASEKFLPNSKKMVELNRELLCLNNEDHEIFDQYDTDTKYDGLSMMDDSRNKEDINITTHLESLTEVIRNWNKNKIKTTTNAIAASLPMLTAMRLAFYQSLNITREGWKNFRRVGYYACIAADKLLCLISGNSLFDKLIKPLRLKLKEWIKILEDEYLKILRIWATSLSIDLEQVRNHQFSFEERIYEKYQTYFAEKTDESIMEQWSEVYFKSGILKNVLNKSDRQHCIRILRCIVNHYQLRLLLSQDLSVAIVGAGKTGKSKLGQAMFGFETNSSFNIRTVDLHSYRVSDQFHIVDFPHLTSAIDSLRVCFQCNHTLVNAIIVVLDALQQGDDNKAERFVLDTIKKMKVEGVNVLYCFNRADKLAIQNTFTAELEENDINEFAECSSENIFSINNKAGELNSGYRVTFDKNDVQYKLNQFAASYGLNVADCMLTFFDLDSSNKDERRNLIAQLSTIGIKNPNDIKNNWLTKVLTENGLKDNEIKKIMDFRHKRKP